MYSMAVPERRAVDPGCTGWWYLPDVITQGGIPNQWWFKLRERAVNHRSSAAVVAWTSITALQQEGSSKARLGGCTDELVSSSRVKVTSSHKWETQAQRFEKVPCHLCHAQAIQKQHFLTLDEQCWLYGLQTVPVVPEQCARSHWGNCSALKKGCIIVVFSWETRWVFSLFLFTCSVFKLIYMIGACTKMKLCWGSWKDLHKQIHL